MTKKHLLDQKPFTDQEQLDAAVALAKSQAALLDRAAEVLESIDRLYGDFAPGVPYDLPDDHPVSAVRALLRDLRDGEMPRAVKSRASLVRREVTHVKEIFT